MKMYWGITVSRSYTRTIPPDQAVMLSACGLWNNKREYFRRKGLIWQDWFLDSGGFSALNLYGDYPYTPDQYLSLVEARQPSVAAAMDYPCEPDITRGSLLSTRDRIEATVDNAVYLCQRSDLIIPVLQGYTLDEYEYCWQLLSGRIRVDRLAIGSLCKRQSSREIATLAWGLRQILPRTLTWIHGFGLKIRALQYPEVWALFSSIDTNAWEFAIRMSDQDITDREGWIAYARKIDHVMTRPRQLALI